MTANLACSKVSIPVNFVAIFFPCACVSQYPRRRSLLLVVGIGAAGAGCGWGGGRGQQRGRLCSLLSDARRESRGLSAHGGLSPLPATRTDHTCDIIPIDRYRINIGLRYRCTQASTSRCSVSETLDQSWLCRLSNVYWNSYAVSEE